jgi:hypothetical protein
VDLAPLATVIGPMLFGLPLTFTRHLDAGAVDQECNPFVVRYSLFVNEIRVGD